MEYNDWGEANAEGATYQLSRSFGIDTKFLDILKAFLTRVMAFLLEVLRL
jgi:hypothetical protein